MTSIDWQPTRLRVLLRTSSKSQVHKGDRIIQPPEECFLTCIHSLRQSLIVARERGYDFTLDVIDDHSDSAFLTELERILKGHKIHILQESGNDMSMQWAYNFAYDNFGDDLIYFVEADYLHREECIMECLRFFETAIGNLESNRVAIHPFDDPDNYKPRWLEPARIVRGPERHWRTNLHTTWTVMVPGRALREHWELFWGFAHYGQHPDIHENTTINHIWRNTYQLFTPIPTLAWHMQFEENQAPFAPWKATYEKFNKLRRNI
jgi:hypothetical protein